MKMYDNELDTSCSDCNKDCKRQTRSRYKLLARGYMRFGLIFMDNGG